MGQNTNSLARVGLYVRLEARPGQESAVAEFLAGALPLAQEEQGTTTWFAVRFGPSTFAVFDSFAEETGRQAHLTGKIAAALMANAEALLATPPVIEKWDALAVKLPK
jgi:quinol monooxygenase YgiN